MKTAERILLTSLALFNQHGEANVSCVDIAVELDISPGNLYYHYKGKEVIVHALFDMFKERVTKLLNSTNHAELTVEEFFYFQLMLLESVHLFRFFYHNPADLLDKYPSISRGFKQVLLNKEACFRSLFESYVKQGKMKLSQSQIEQIVYLSSMLFTSAHNYSLLKGEDVNSEAYLFHILGNSLFMLKPYMQIEDGVLEHLRQDIENQTL
ncbi:TetR/AcrR family transcriptional regulator [Alteromonas sp. a30]|uniref:TetR/AcrR family transcriptional regulator n=1 Tax=Alteromonas sp. a30 TaxID=2730917 RepID=UPI00227EDC42|nr:TetR/AcrR family transcriptional regulator [Alteromonas sp. a30]MCY7296836.1 TetR family transcriptional regulator [Alteromonas sp. a30]